MKGDSKQTPYWNPYVAGIVLGTVLFLSFILTQSGLGASGGLARIVAWGTDIVAPSYVDKTPVLAKVAGGVRNPLNHRLVWLIIGVAIGGFTSGVLVGRFHIETRKGPHVGSNRVRWAMAITGGIIAGYGTQLARGCTSGQALSGGATLALGSWFTMFAIFGGGYLLAYPLRRFWI